MIRIMNEFNNMVQNFRELGRQGELNKFYNKHYKFITNFMYIYVFIAILLGMAVVIVFLDSAILLLLQLTDVGREFVYNKSLSLNDIHTGVSIK